MTPTLNRKRVVWGWTMYIIMISCAIFVEERIKMQINAALQESLVVIYITTGEKTVQTCR